MKFNTVSGKFDVSSTQIPGRGSGILDFRTGSQAEFEVACSLNFPVLKEDYIKYESFSSLSEGICGNIHSCNSIFTCKSSMHFIDIKTTNSRTH